MLEGEREDEQIALPGNDHSEEAAIGRDREIAEAEPVKDGDRSRLRDGNLMIRGDRRERRKVNPHEVP